MSQSITVTDAAPRPTLVVPATTTWPEFPALWKGLLDEVWDCLRSAGVTGGCRNVMLYRDDIPNVEIGVECADPVPLSGRVVRSTLPSGRVAMATHRGSYADLGDTHRAILDHCATNGFQPTGTRWEVYGPHRDDPAEVWVEVYYLL